MRSSIIATILLTSGIAHEITDTVSISSAVHQFGSDIFLQYEKLPDSSTQGFITTDVNGQLIYQKPLFYVSRGGPTSSLAPSLYTGISAKSGRNVLVLANLVDPTHPTNVAQPATAFLVSNKGCTKLQSTWAGCTVTNAQATINVPLRCVITVEAFRTAVDELPYAKQEFKFEPDPASLLGTPLLDPITKRLDLLSKPQQLVFDKLSTAYKFRLSAVILGTLEEAIPVKLSNSILSDLIDSVGKTGVAVVSDDWSYMPYEQGAKECKA
jgi:hypothetical protein